MTDDEYMRRLNPAAHLTTRDVASEPESPLPAEPLPVGQGRINPTPAPTLPTTTKP